MFRRGSRRKSCSAKLGQPVVIENRPGAGGALGARVVATAAPDGYTLLVGNTSVLVGHPRGVGQRRLRPGQEFRPDRPHDRELPDSRGAMRTRRGRRSRSSSTTARPIPARSTTPTPAPAACRIWSASCSCCGAAAKMTGVPYRSGGESVTAVLSKAVDTTIEGIAITRSLILDGKLRALGGQNKTRTPLLPDMPTMAEAGVPDAEANTFYGLVAPAGTPRGHRQEAQRGDERGPCHRGDAEDDHRHSAANPSRTRRRSSPPTSPRKTRSGSRSAKPPA